MSEVTLSQPSLPTAIAAGEILGEKYRIVRRLGQGGMGAVYEAEHSFLRRRFAIKLLKLEHAQDAEMIARFSREAQATGRLENDHVAAVSDFGLAPNGSPYFVMEYLDGESLARIVAREGPLSVKRGLGLVLQACKGVAAAHAQGIVHRDLKPDNLFVCRKDDGSELLKVLDFGIARFSAGGDDGLVTRTGTTLGTPCYMSPEQARGAIRIDHRSDIYSLGAVLYEVLSGERAHSGANYNEIIYNILSQQPAPLLESCPGLSPRLANVVERAMAKDREDRIQTVSELVSALLQASKPGADAGIDTLKAVTAAGPPAADVGERALGSASTASVGSRFAHAEPPGMRARARVVALGIALVAAAALAFMLRSRGGPAQGEAASSSSQSAVTLAGSAPALGNPPAPTTRAPVLEAPAPPGVAPLVSTPPPLASAPPRSESFSSAPRALPQAQTVAKSAPSAAPAPSTGKPAKPLLAPSARKYDFTNPYGQ